MCFVDLKIQSEEQQSLDSKINWTSHTSALNYDQRGLKTKQTPSVSICFYDQVLLVQYQWDRSADYSAHLAVAQVSAPALPFIFPALRIELRLWCWNAVWLLAWGSCYGFCALDDCCLCCRLVGTSRMTVFVKTPARASCATNPTCTSWFQILMENTTSGLPVSRNVHVRMELSQLNIPSTSQGCCVKQLGWASS